MIFLFMLKMFLAAVLTVAGLAIGLKAMISAINAETSDLFSYIIYVIALALTLVSGFAFVAQVL
jgi:hypothetical protein